MANWQTIKGDVKSAANKTIHKTGEMAEVAKLHVQVANLIAKCDKQFEKLGKLTYRQLKSNSTSYAEPIAAVLANIDELTGKISRLKARIADIKAQAAAEKESRINLHCECSSDIEDAQEYVDGVQEIINEGLEDIED